MIDTEVIKKEKRVEIFHEKITTDQILETDFQIGHKVHMNPDISRSDIYQQRR